MCIHILKIIVACICVLVIDTIFNLIFIFYIAILIILSHNFYFVTTDLSSILELICKNDIHLHMYHGNFRTHVSIDNYTLTRSR